MARKRRNNSMQTRDAQFKFLCINSAVKTKTNRVDRVCSISSCALGEYVDACTIERKAFSGHVATSATTALSCVRVLCLCEYIQEEVSTRTQALRLSEARCTRCPLLFSLSF